MPPSHHSSSSHSSHSSHSHHSSSHSHSSSRSYHSSSSHSSSYRSSAASTRNTRIITPIYRARSNQPLGYTGTKSPRVYRCKNHDYVHYDHPWTDDKTGVEYKAGFYDEEGTFYEDIVFSKQGEILDTTTAVCRCDYCRMEDSRRHQLLWKIAYYPVKLFLRLRFMIPETWKTWQRPCMKQRINVGVPE